MPVRGAGAAVRDVQIADRRLAVVEGKGGHHRIVPVANRFFDALGAYLHDERPAASYPRSPQGWPEMNDQNATGP